MMKTIAALLAKTTLSEAALFEVEDNGASGKVDLATLRKAIVPSGVPDTAPLQSQIDTHTTQISQLNDTFGSATAAKTSADQAEATRVSTVQIKGQTEQSASDALAARDRAVAAANNAESQIVTLGNDGIITKHEKITVLIPQDTRLESLYNTLDPIAADLGITTERTAATNARSSWITYRNGLDRWNDITIDTPVVRADLRSAVGNYADSLEALAGKISGQAAIVLTSDGEAFVFTDGAADNPAQSITLTVTRQNTSETVTWATSPVVTLTGTGDSRSLSIADFGTNRQVIVTVTGNTSRAKDQITLVRLEKSTAVAGAGTSGQFNLIAGSAAVEKVGNRHKKTGGVHASWDAAMVAPGLPGTAYISGVPIVASSGWAVGLALDTEAGGFLDTEQKYLAVFTSDVSGAAHVITIKSNGVQIATATFAGATLRTFALAYDGVKVYGIYDGVVRCSASAEAGLTLFPKTMHHHVGNGLTDVLYGPYTDNAFDSSKMGPLAPANNATVGAPAGTSVGATLAETVEARANDPAARINVAATLLNATKMQYGPGVLVSDKEPAEAGADVTAGKDLSVLVGRVADNIAESAARKWAGESGATKNVIWRQATDPGASAANGDFWVNTGVTPNVTKVRVAGAWADAANLVLEGPHIGVASGATRGRNLILNPGGESGGTEGWAIHPSYAGGAINSSTDYAHSGSRSLKMAKPALTDSISMDTRAFAVTPGEKIRIAYAMRGSAASADGFYARVLQGTAIDAAGNLTNRASQASFTNLVANGPMPPAFTYYSYEYTVPAGVTYIGLLFLNYSTADVLTVYLDEIELSPQLDFATGIGGSAKPADNATVGAPAGTSVGATLAETVEARANDPAARINVAATLLNATKMQYGPGVLVSDKEPAETAADVTSNVGHGPAVITIECDHQGAALSGQLPRAEIYKLIKNGTALTAGVTWTYQVLSGTINGFTNASAAQALAGAGSTSFEVASLGTNEARVHIIAVEGGRTRKLEVLVRKNLAPPPASGSSGGGTSASDSTLASIASDAWAVLSDELTVTLGSAATSAALSAGSIELRGAASSPDGTWDIAFKWEWWNGTAWAIVGLEANSDPDPSVEYDAETAKYYSLAGEITCNRTQTGLTSGSTHKFRLLGRHTTAGATKTVNVTGTVSAQG